MNTYGYVSGNPIANTDPLGLIEWTGTMSGAVMTKGVGAGGFKIVLESECVNGKKAIVTMIAVGPAVGVGALLDVSVSDIELTDQRNHIDPRNLEGFFSYASVSWAVGVGYGAYSIAMGNSGSVNSPNGARGAGHGGYGGYGLGASNVIGSATITDIKFEKCGDDGKASCQ